jgi:hypothetical protein
VVPNRVAFWERRDLFTWPPTALNRLAGAVRPCSRAKPPKRYNAAAGTASDLTFPPHPPC